MEQLVFSDPVAFSQKRGGVTGTFQLSSQTFSRFLIHLKLKSGTAEGQESHALIYLCPYIFFYFLLCSYLLLQALSVQISFCIRSFFPHKEIKTTYTSAWHK